MNVLRGFYSATWEIARKLAGRFPWIVNGFIYRVIYLKAIARHGFKRRTIITYPQRPRPYHILYKMAHILGYRLTTDLRADAVACLAFRDTTVWEPDAKLTELAAIRPVLNCRCIDISKKHVGAVFERVFGYTLTVDPCTFTGECVKKSNDNGTHDGVIITCPIRRDEVDHSCIYQRVVNNRIAGSDLVFDIRVPVYDGVIPFAYLKYRDANRRFDNCLRSVTVDVAEVLSPEEIQKTCALCRALGLDLGELDILRDLDEGRIYIVDVNKTPGTPVKFSPRDRWTVLERMATAFERTFLEVGSNDIHCPKASPSRTG